MRLRICAPILLFILLIASVVSAADGPNDIAKRNHPPAQGGILGVVWVDDITPSIYTQQNVSAAINIIQSNVYPTWEVRNAQDDFILFLSNNPQIQGDNWVKAQYLAQYSYYTYILCIAPIGSNIQNITMHSNQAAYDNLALKDVSLSISMGLYDMNGYVSNGGASWSKSNQTKSLESILSDLFPIVIRNGFSCFHGFFNPPKVENNIGERTGKIPAF